MSVAVRGMATQLSLPEEVPPGVDGGEAQTTAPAQATSASSATAAAASAARGADRDGDGVRDEDDQCPDHWEDCDGFEDRDGCPELDNDRDRILDACDRCPNEPENYNGIQDDDGCPDRGSVIVQTTSIRILQFVQFAARRSQVAAASMPILEETARVLIGNPQIERVAIVGHASPDEPDAQRLSQQRADAVIEQLVQRGVQRARLEGHGSAAAFPLAPNTSEANRSRNRRVGFLILRIDGVTERQWQGNRVVDVPRAPVPVVPSSGAIGGGTAPLPRCPAGSPPPPSRPPAGGCPG